MADSSRSRITITLGRSGQVVKRDISVTSGSYSDSHPISRMKRSARDRIGDNDDSFSRHGSQTSSSKRQRGESRQSLDYSGFDDGKIRKDDLRSKLMQKNASRRAESDNRKKHVDLRDKLSKPAHPLVMNPESRHRLPVPDDMRILRQPPPSRSAEELTRMESMKSSCSPWELDHIRRRLSDQFVSTSSVISSHRNVDDLPRRPLNGTYDDVRSVPYLTKDVPDNARPPCAARPLSTSTFAPQPSMSALPSMAAKRVAPCVDQLPPPLSTVAPKSSFVGDGQQTPQTVDGLLHLLGLGKYAITFQAEEVDMTALKQMGENDLKELGIPMGPRKKILLALAPRTKRQSLLK